MFLFFVHLFDDIPEMSDGIIIEVIIGIGEAQGTNDTVLRLTSDGIAVFFTDRERSATFGVTANFKIHRQSVQSKTSTGILYHKRPQKATHKKKIIDKRR